MSPRPLSHPRIFLGWPWGPTLFPAFTALVALSTWVASIPPSQPFAQWNVTSSTFHEGLMLSLPAIALWSSAFGVTVGARHSIFAEVSVRARLRQLVLHCAVITAWAVAGVLAGLTPLLWWTQTTATWGGPVWSEALVALGGVVLVCSGSFAVASFFPTLAWAPLPALVVLVWLHLPLYMDRAVSVTSPVRSWPSYPSVLPNPAVTGYFVLFTGAALLWVWVSVVDRPQRSSRLGGLSPASILMAIPVTALVLVPFAWRPDLYLPASPMARQCQLVDQTRACVHPANAARLPEVKNLLGQLGQLGWSSTLSGLEDTDISSTYSFRPGVLVVRLSPSQTAQDLRLDSAYSLSGLTVCSELYADSTLDTEGRSTVSAAVARSLLHRLGQSDSALAAAPSVVDQRLASMSPAEFTSFIQRYGLRLMQCGVPESELR